MESGTMLYAVFRDGVQVTRWRPQRKKTNEIARQMAHRDRKAKEFRVRPALYQPTEALS